MGKATGIEWCDHTFNPWWGCAKVSPACRDCYAEVWAERFPKTQGLWGAEAPRKPASEESWAEVLRWSRQAQKAGVQRRVFCASMADVFEDRPDLRDLRRRLFALVMVTAARGAGPGLVWMFLTKRPGNVLEHAAGTALEPVVLGDRAIRPKEQVWFGATMEDQECLEERAPELGRIRARVLFASCEPLLGHLNMTPAFEAGVGWVIAGGESGSTRSRPMHTDWVRSIRDQCRIARRPFFFKQWGDWRPRLVAVAGSGPARARGGNWGVVLPSGNFQSCVTPWNGRELADSEMRECSVVMVGKGVAGAELDGREHREFPAR